MHYRCEWFIYMYALDTYKAHVGIVLRYIPQASRVVILDRFLGKHKAICFSALSAGSCISYDRLGYGHSMRIYVHEVLYMPLHLARSHLPFLHQMLEVCDASLPFESVDEEIFILLFWVCAFLKETIEEYQQDLILAKLFVLLGLHTTHCIVCDTCIALIHAASVDTMSDLALDSKCAAKLKKWLYYCLSEQLSEQCLKTGILFKKE